MPIIDFTPGDALKTVVVPDGAYTLKLTEIKAPGKSSTGNSVNYWGTIQITKGEYSGKEFTVCFNTAMNNSSLLGSNMFFAFSDMLKINAVLTGNEVKPENVRVDTDTLIDKEFDGQIKKTINSEGQTGNLITAFLPAGKATGAPAF